MFLSHVLSNSLPIGTLPPLVLISDCFLQSGLSLIREFISTSLERNEVNIVILLEQTATKLFDSTESVLLLDCIHSLPFATTSTSTTQFIDLDSENGISLLISSILSSIESKKKENKKIIVTIDSLNVLGDYGTHTVTRVIRKILKALESCASGSRLVGLHHAGFPTLSQESHLNPSLLTTLLSPIISSATVHLTLHPSPLIELLSREYNLMIPLSDAAEIDLKLTSFLTSFTNRVYGNPFIRPSTSEMEDERLELNLGEVEGKGYVVEFTTRGVTMPILAGRNKKVAVGTAKKIISRGLEGMKRNGIRLEAVALREVVNYDKMSSLSISQPILSSLQPPKIVEPVLPFNLSLTESQKLSREEVVLPYLLKEGESTGNVSYVADDGDDFDDDDPDEDLEI